jgi:hypothetical protein
MISGGSPELVWLLVDVVVLVDSVAALALIGTKNPARAGKKTVSARTNASTDRTLWQYNFMFLKSPQWKVIVSKACQKRQSLSKMPDSVELIDLMATRLGLGRGFFRAHRPVIITLDG